MSRKVGDFLNISKHDSKMVLKNIFVYSIKYIINIIFIWQMIILTVISYMARDMSDIISIFKIAFFPFILLCVHMLGYKFLKINTNRIMAWLYIFILTILQICISFDIIESVLINSSVNLYKIIYDLMLLIFANVFICIESFSVKG